MPFVVNNPLSLELIEKTVNLEIEFSKKEGFDSSVILDSHMQLLAVAIVTCCNYNPIECQQFFHMVGHKIGDLIAEEVGNKPINLDVSAANKVM